MPLREERILKNIKSGSLFGSVQDNIEPPQYLRETLAKFPLFPKNINVHREDISLSIEENAEKEELWTQRRRMLISSHFLKNETIVTPLLLFYLDWLLNCEKTIALRNTLQKSASTTLFSLQ